MLTYGELFAGYDGLGMGVRSILGGESLWFAEFDKAPSKILAHHYPDVPNLGDVTKVDWHAVPKVDVITGGSPCQDLSHAGKRKGMTDGTRSNLWVEMREAIAVIRPRLVVWENVRGALSAPADSDLEPCPGCVGDLDDGPVLRALGRVLGDLAELGYDARWYGLRAADVGAAHGRFRIFLFATPADADDTGWGEHGWPESVRPQQPAAERASDATSGLRTGARPDGSRLTATLLEPSLPPSQPATRRQGCAPSVAACACRSQRDLEEGVEVVAGLDVEGAPLGTVLEEHDGDAAAAHEESRHATGAAVHDVLALLPAGRPEASGERFGERATGGVVGVDLVCGSGPCHDTNAENRLQPSAAIGLTRCAACGCSDDLHDSDGFCAGPCGGNAFDCGGRGRLLPTPRATDGTKGGPNQRGSSGDLMLPSAVHALLPTPSVNDRATSNRELTAFQSLTKTATTTQDWREYEAAIRRHEHALGRPAPSPTEPGAKGQPRLSPAFVEWLMMLPDGWVTDVPGISRNDMLKALGNGVVVPQAAAATRAFVHDTRQEAVA